MRFRTLYFVTLAIVAAVWVGYLLYRHWDCAESGGYLARGVFWMECLPVSPPGTQEIES